LLRLCEERRELREPLAPRLSPDPHGHGFVGQHSAEARERARLPERVPRRLRPLAAEDRAPDPAAEVRRRAARLRERLERVGGGEHARARSGARARLPGGNRARARREAGLTAVVERWRQWTRPEAPMRRLARSLGLGRVRRLWSRAV